MAQSNPLDFNINPATTSGTELSDILNRFHAAVNTIRSGTGRPPDVMDGTTWMDTTNALTFIIYHYTGTVDIELYRIDTATDAITFPIATQISGKVDTTGDTMTGPLIINAPSLSVGDGSVDSVVNLVDSLARVRGILGYDTGVNEVYLRRYDSAASLETSLELSDDGNVTVNATAPTQNNHLARKDYVDVKQTDLENVDRVDLGNSFSTSNRDCIIDFHSSGTPNNPDYSSRIYRRPGVDGDLQLLNSGTGNIAFVVNGFTPVSLESSSVDCFAPVTTTIQPTSSEHLTRKDYVDGNDIDAWCIFDGIIGGNNAPDPNNNNNILSINHYAVGAYTINFINNMNTTKYCVAFSSTNNNVVRITSTDLHAFSIEVKDVYGNTVDATFNSIMVIGA